ncbi:sensor histidine kinase [Aurantibacillus circumpalustris]|uniref:sensor histidine kinase n=1 Tax=Aurantibacillus circumpalustris TaxID=3036359 RepID=UPI00295A5875|nr:histidine kinase [Aurantibacillus circumpalustris]
MKKSVLIMFHLAFWIFTSLLIVLVFQIILASSWVIFQSRLGPTVSDNLKGLLIILPVGACIFYSSYFSFPYFAKRFIRFVWFFAAFFTLMLLISIPGYVQQKASLKGAEMSTMQGILAITVVASPLLYFIILGFLFRIFIEWIKDIKIKTELEKDKIASQLELLKSKINPHFLFNTLNNIDVFIQDDPIMASEYLRKLSDILRFMLYESNAEKIPLTMEIEYIQKYIDLQKIRTANEKFVNIEINGNTNGKYLSPMILIHLIENAFKYATNKKIENAIAIRFDITENHLLFFCKNHIHEPKEINTENNGLGIQLLKQKLELLYKNTYKLTVKEENNWYLVNLEISFS